MLMKMIMDEYYYVMSMWINFFITMNRTSGSHFPFRTTVLYQIIFFFILLHQTVISLKFQTSNINAGRARLVFFQGKTRHEIIGRSCPVGVTFTSPQLFSCACVTGVWAFYDIMCASPLQIIGGVNHCFKMPLDTYIQEAMLLSNPTRAHGDSLTVFNGDMESVLNKYFRETHSPLKTSGQLLTVGPSWTLRDPSGTREICLDSTKNKIFEDSDAPSLTSAYCNFANVSKSIPKIGSVNVGCKDKATKVEPQYCYPFLDSNSEEICTDLALLEAYEMAVEQESNDLTNRNSSTREFKRLVTNKKTKSKTMKTSTTNMMTKKSSEKATTTSTAALDNEKSTRGMDRLEDTSNRLTNDIDSDRDISRREKEKARAGIPSFTINPVQDNLLKDDSAADDSGVDDDSVSARSHRQAIDDLASEPFKDPTINDEATMRRIYQETIQNPDNFLTLSGSESDKVVLKHLWEYQQEQIKLALQLKLSDKRTLERAAAPKLQIREVLDRAIDIMMSTCQAVPRGFLQLAMDTFINIQEKEFRWHPPFFTDKELDGILSSLERCKNHSQGYNFVNNGVREGNGTTCARRNPEELLIGSRKVRLDISEKIKSDGYEPLIESLWKVGVHAITYCEPYLHTDFRASSKLNIAMTQVFRNQIHLLWFGNKMIELEYSGVLGDTKVVLKDLDLCLVAAKRVTSSITEYHRPEFVAPPGWLPRDATEEPIFNLTGNENESQRGSRNIDSKSSSKNQIPPSYLMDQKNEETAATMILDSIVDSTTIKSTTTTTTTTPTTTTTIPTTTLKTTTSSTTVQPSESITSPQNNKTGRNIPSLVEPSPVSVNSTTVLTPIFSQIDVNVPLAQKVAETTATSSSLLVNSTKSASQLPTTVDMSATSIQNLQVQPPPTTASLNVPQNTSSSTPMNYTTTPIGADVPTSINDMMTTPSSVESTSGSEEEETGSENPANVLPTSQEVPVPVTISSSSASTTESTQPTIVAAVTGEKKSRRKRSLNDLDMAKAQENWRKQRTILSGMAICLKKFDEVQTHLGQDCE